MLEEQDIKKIGEEMGKVIEQNILPAIEDAKQELKTEIADVKQELKADIAGVQVQMVTKSYLDDKMGDLEGVTVVRQRKEDQKVNRLIEILEEKGVIQDADVVALKEIKVFPL